MSAEVVVVGRRTGSCAPSKGSVPIESLEADPFRLDGVVVFADVTSPVIASRVLHAVIRGASAEVRLNLGDAEEAIFLDELGRVATVRFDTLVVLDVDQRRLLELLCRGHSLGDAARMLGWSRRTADRRLASARASLSVGTTSEAIRQISRTPAEDRRSKPRSG